MILRSARRAAAKLTSAVWSFDRITAVTGAAIAVLALVATAGQYWIASDTEKRSLRAYVGVNSILPQLKTAPKGINVFVQNGGQTPAYHVTVHLSGEPVPIGGKLPAGFGYADKGDRDLARSSLAILSGGSGSKEIPFTIPFDHDEVFSKVESHANEGYFYGHVDYDDIFDGHWLTEICYRYTFEGTPRTVGISCLCAPTTIKQSHVTNNRPPEALRTRPMRTASV